mgnify:CR=1 FL=1
MAQERGQKLILFSAMCLGKEKKESNKEVEERESGLGGR